MVAGANVNAVDKEQGWTPLYDACYCGHEAMVMPLVIAGANVNAVGKQGCTPLHIACQNGYEAVVNGTGSCKCKCECGG